MAIQADPALALAFNARGFAHLELKQYAAAIDDFGAPGLGERARGAAAQARALSR